MSKLFYVATSFLLLTISVTMFLGMREASPAFGNSPTLDGFDIKTGDSQVVVTLYTDERAPFKTETTEANGTRQFAIVLPKAKLSQEQLNNGLPVVMDNKNKFIGRAVPTDDGQVKILLPNIPVEQYAISVRQQPVGKSAPALFDAANEKTVLAHSSANQPISLAGVAEPAAKTTVANSMRPAVAASERPAIEPRPAVTTLNSRFEQIASSFDTDNEAPASRGPRIERISQAPHGKTSSPARSIERNAPAPQAQVVENPYVASMLRNPPKPNYLKQDARANTSTPDQAITTLSVAESLERGNNSPVPVKDPLWYLHSLPPFDPTQGLKTNTLSVAAQQDQAALAGTTPAQPSAVETAAVATDEATASPMTEFLPALQHLPKWLMVMMALFLGGIGLFAGVGSLLVIRQLYQTLRQKPQTLPQGATAQFFYTGMSPALGVSAAGLAQQYNLAVPMAVAEVPVSAANVEELTRFADTTTVNAMDYLQHQSRLLTFPSTRKAHLRTKASVPRRIGGR